MRGDEGLLGGIFGLVRVIEDRERQALNVSVMFPDQALDGLSGLGGVAVKVGHGEAGFRGGFYCRGGVLRVHFRRLDAPHGRILQILGLL